ncbi:MAG: dihydrofolate reductase [Bacteroidales bacterium]|nr:dihydrofolate reductase [Bacteroidales bacterium]
MIAGASLSLVSCGQKGGTAETKDDFKYLIDEFADLKIIRYRVPQWEELSLSQKEYIYHLSEAAKWGRDIIWAQHFKYNLDIRHTLEGIISDYPGDRSTPEFQSFMVYAKRVFFSNGIHHHYAEEKFVPEISREYFASLVAESGLAALDKDIVEAIFDPEIYRYRRYIGTDKDQVAESAINFYEGVTKKEVQDFYNKQRRKDDPRPISYGLNTKLVKENGKIVEKPYKIDGLYGKAIAKVVEELRQAAACAENDAQREYIALLIKYYETGDLKIWDDYNVAWVQDTSSDVDFVNGFVEDYSDPLGMKASWEANINFRNKAASARTETISDNAQWFEDNSPIDQRFKKQTVKGVSAKVINVAQLAGDAFPYTAIGINLPNADWIRKEYGSKSVTIDNITEAYAKAAEESPKSVLGEFAWDEKEIARSKEYGSICDNLHTDLHECLGHGSGQILPGVSSNALGEYQSTLEEARADLFGLYYLADHKLVELGLLPNEDAYKASYDGYIRNGSFTQFSRVELGKLNTEAHMQNRKLISDWCIEKGKEANVIEKKVRDGKTYFVINDYEALRGLFGDLLAEIQRIKSEGDYEAGKALVEGYAVRIDPELHKEVLERYASLELKPYGGFVNPVIYPVTNDKGEVIDYDLDYSQDFVGQMMYYGKNYSTL